MKTMTQLSEKFRGIPVDVDTRIRARYEIKIGSYDAVHEKWVWDGIYGESYIFFNEDIKDLSEADVLKLSNKEGTYKKIDRYTFVNFNFEVS
ncbi:MAG: hypothetical protein U9Q90_05760 [Campylobacterota bacterium]|nr:hypothetical protein [Campylobacterota bacterium]